jgi:hypothetical protein
MLRVSCVPAVLASATGQLGRAVLGLVAGEHMEIASRRVITPARRRAACRIVVRR